MQRRALFLGTALAAVLPCAGRAAGGAGLPRVTSLQREIATALRRGRALVVMVSLDGCPFCKVVRDSHLAPLQREDGQPVVQLDMGSPAPLVDPLGRTTTHGALATAWKIRVAPTVLFLGAGGRELAPRLEGAGIPDFYGAYLGERLLAANRLAAG